MTMNFKRDQNPSKYIKDWTSLQWSEEGSFIGSAEVRVQVTDPHDVVFLLIPSNPLDNTWSPIHSSQPFDWLMDMIDPRDAFLLAHVHLCHVLTFPDTWLSLLETSSLGNYYPIGVIERGVVLGFLWIVFLPGLKDEKGGGCFKKY